MDEQKIETLLKKAPAPRAPGGLLDQLVADVRVPRQTAPSTPRAEWSAPASIWKRWLPAVSFALILLTCVVAIAVQTNVISELQKQNNDLRGSGQSLEDLRQQNADLQRFRNESDELERLRKDAAELATLRDEVSQLSAQLKDLEQLRADNQGLQAAIAAKKAAANEGDEEVLIEARKKAESVQCMNNLRQIGTAFRLWADDNKGVFPTDFLSMTNELAGSAVLRCPSDKNVPNVPNIIQAINQGAVSYKLMSTGRVVHDNEADVVTLVLAECPIHGNVVFADGSAQRLSPEEQAKLQTSNGVTRYIRQAPDAAK